MKTQTDFIGARLPITTLAAVDALAARLGITRTAALDRVLIAGLEALALAPPRPEPQPQPAMPSEINVEAVFPPKLSLLLIEIAARMTLAGKKLGIDMTQAEAVRAAYKNEFL